MDAKIKATACRFEQQSAEFECKPKHRPAALLLSPWENATGERDTILEQIPPAPLFATSRDQIDICVNSVPGDEVIIRTTDELLSSSIRYMAAGLTVVNPDGTVVPASPEQYFHDSMVSFPPMVVLKSGETKLRLENPGYDVGKYYLKWNVDKETGRNIRVNGEDDGEVTIDCTGGWPRDYTVVSLVTDSSGEEWIEGAWPFSAEPLVVRLANSYVGHWGPIDIRELKIHVVVFQKQTYFGPQPVATQAEVYDHLSGVIERLAQSGIRVDLNVNMGTGTGVPPPAEIASTFCCNGSTRTTISADEAAIISHKDSDPDSIDIFYVNDQVNELLNVPVAGQAYIKDSNQTGDPDAENFIVLDHDLASFAELTPAHEVMHILLNSRHRPGEPTTALFHAGGVPCDRNITSAKRIGPYPDATSAGVGTSDTTQIRAAAENLPKSSGGAP